MKSPPATHTQHLKEIERGGDKKKQKKWNKQKAQKKPHTHKDNIFFSLFPKKENK